MDTEKIIDYIVETPCNTNPNVVRSMLNQVVKSDIPDPSTANVGEVLTKGEDGLEWAYPENELPVIQAEDAGKVVKVNEAGTRIEYGEAGGGTFVTTFTITVPMPMFPDNKEITADHTPAEVITALNTGKICIGIEGNDVYSIVSSDASDQSKLVFGSFNTSGSKFIKTKWALGTDYTWDPPINGDPPPRAR